MKVGRRTLIGAGVAGVAALGLAQVVGPGSEVATPGRSRARAIRTDARPPAEADVVIIGGGNIGAATAYYLAKRGLKVVVCEKGAIGGEASCRSVGHVYTLGSSVEDLPYALYSHRLWRDLNQELGIETGYRKHGLLWEVSEPDHPYWEEWVRAANAMGSEARLLTPNEVAALVPMTKPWFAGVYAPNDATAEPTLVAAAYAEAAQRLGAHIVAPCAVRGLDMAGGKVTGVITEHGPIRAGAVLLAGGAWSTAFMQNLGLSLPTGSIFAWCASFYQEGGGEAPAANAIYQNTTWRSQLDGGFTTSIRGGNAPITPQLLRYANRFMHAFFSGPWPVHPRLGGYSFEQMFTPGSWKMDEVSPFEKRRILEPALNQMVIDQALTHMRKDVPAFQNIRLGDAWGGCINVAPDELPVIGAVTGISGLLVATAMGDGLTLGPATGATLANMITGAPLEVDIARFGLGRFARPERGAH